MSKILSTIAIAGLVLSLVACSGTGSSAAACTPTQSGTASNSVKVTGKYGSAPKVTVKKGLTTKATERSVVIEGKGPVADQGNTAALAITAYNGTTGKELSSSGYTQGTLTVVPVDAKQVIPGVAKAVKCSAAGSRVVAAITPADGFADQGSQMGVGPKDTLVLVIDVVDVTKATKANGAPQPPVAGLPTVKLASNGAPTVTIPKTTPPTDLKIADLKKGTGAKVKAGATVTVQYVGVLWATGKVFDSSWSRGAPSGFPTTGVVPGFSKALVGQTVGSQVLAVIPPAEGYGATPPASSGISPTDTLVFVVDILAAD
ncbi:MAG: peptidylprolyl isomerase [Microbacteriaceae bacterium]|nr:peptidylprolyl isomerase [Microbacteriaceae bacterium]